MEKNFGLMQRCIKITCTDFYLCEVSSVYQQVSHAGGAGLCKLGSIYVCQVKDDLLRTTSKFLITTSK